MEKNIKNEVMSQIKSGQLDMRSRWIYVAQKLGLESGLALLLVVLSFLVNIFFFYIQTNKLLPFLHEGSGVWQKIFHSLPYDLIIIIVILILALNFIIKKFDFSYKKSFALISIIFITLVIWTATMLFISNFNIAVKNSLNRKEYYLPYFSHFYMERCPLRDHK